MLLLSGKTHVRGGAEDAGGVVKMGEGSSVPGLEAPTLGRREVVGQAEGSEVVEGAVSAVEAALEFDGPRREGGRTGLGANAGERVAQQAAPFGLVTGAKGLDECRSLTLRQPVAIATLEDSVLVLVAELA